MTDENTDASTGDTKPASMLALTTQVVAAYIGKNPMPGTELPALIDRVFQSLAGLATSSTAAPETRPEPAVPVKKSVFADYIVCLEDGKKMKMLKRHLLTSYGLTPNAYRQRWGLPSDYPMVAPSYAERRSTLAKPIGLGRKPSSAVADVAPWEEHVTPTPEGPWTQAGQGRRGILSGEAAGLCLAAVLDMWRRPIRTSCSTFAPRSILG